MLLVVVGWLTVGGGEVVLWLGGGGRAQLTVGQGAGDVRLGQHLTQVPYQGVTVSQDYFAKQFLFSVPIHPD